MGPRLCHPNLPARCKSLGREQKGLHIAGTNMPLDPLLFNPLSWELRAGIVLSRNKCLISSLLLAVGPKGYFWYARFGPTSGYSNQVANEAKLKGNGAIISSPHLRGTRSSHFFSRLHLSKRFEVIGCPLTSMFLYTRLRARERWYK